MKTKIDHSITLTIIFFIIILFSVIQISAQETDNKEKVRNEKSANIKPPKDIQAFDGEVAIKVGSNTLLKIEEEGPDGGSVYLPDVGSTPTSTVGKLYNNGGDLYWGNNVLGSTSSFTDDWDDDGVALFMYSPSRKVGIGTVITETTTKLHVKGDEGVLFQGTHGNGSALSFGAGTRFHFYPKKSALRSGYVNGAQWDDANIGNYSTAFGINNIANGFSSTSLGQNSIASGFISFAFGLDTKTVGNYASSFGVGTRADAFYSTAVGAYNIGGGTVNAKVLTEPVFEVGIGNSDIARENAMTVLKSGFVGIGSATPSSTLQVNSKSGENPLAVQFNGVNKLAVNSNGGTSVGTSATPPTNGLLVSGTLKASTVIQTNNLDSQSGNVSVNNNLYVNTTNVGIGTSTPTKKLEVNGTVKLGSTEVSNVKIGSGGTIISEIIKLTGTTNASDDITEIIVPTGYYDYSHVLACKVRQPNSSNYDNNWDDATSWKAVGSDPNSVFVFQWHGGNLRMRISQNKFRGQPYEIILMKID
ncbi:MAG: hypothetical protein H6612_04405 [Ignavibacteriales bacterium]|nr:hypothetical protein [Ignavibacteriales bacterium]